jgi:hypothetical protein
MSPTERKMLTGMGRCNLLAAIFSPGDSKATVGEPNVAPRRDARAPPSEWPMIQMLLVGYIYVRLLYRFYSKRNQMLPHRDEHITHNSDRVKQAFFNQRFLQAVFVALTAASCMLELI